MTDGQFLTLGVTIAGQVFTVAAVLLANARQAGQRDEQIRGLERELKVHRADNAADHARYDRHIATQHAHGGR